MRHWIEVSSTEALPNSANPPIPRHHASNDVTARLARVEEHLQWSHHARGRDREDSRERARDLAAAIVDLRDAFQAEMAPIRAMMAAKAARLEVLVGLRIWAYWCAKLLLGVLLVLGTITGRLSPEQAKTLGVWLGLPG